MGADRMSEVELVELAGDRAAPRPGSGRERDGAGVRRRRLLRRWWPVPVAVLAALVAGQSLDASREQADAERRRGVPGVLATTVTAPLEATAWGSGAAAVDVLAAPVRAADGLLVGAVRPGTARPADVVGLDPGTGEEVWRRTIAAPPPPGGYVLVPTCSSGADPARVLWCTVADGSAPGAPGPVPTRLVRVDLVERSVGQGEVLPPGSAAVAVGSTVVVATSGPRSVDLVATDGISGELRWRSAVPDPLGSSGGGAGPLLSVVDGHLLVGGLTRTWSLDPGTGAVQANGPVLLVVRGGRLVELTGSGGTQVLGADGTGTVLTEGQALPTAPDDGSAPGLLLVRVPDGTTQGALRAVDADTGEVVWTRAGRGSVATRPLVLDGVVYGSSSREVWAVDLETGADRWAAPGEPGDAGVLLTDGVALLRTELVRSTSRRVLAAYALDDGRRLWATPLPDGVDQVRAQDGVLYGSGTDGVVTLG
jgi:outer membrane protein assembly factor BamB